MLRLRCQQDYRQKQQHSDGGPRHDEQLVEIERRIAFPRLQSAPTARSTRPLQDNPLSRD